MPFDYTKYYTDTPRFWSIYHATQCFIGHREYDRVKQLMQDLNIIEYVITVKAHEHIIIALLEHGVERGQLQQIDNISRLYNQLDVMNVYVNDVIKNLLNKDVALVVMLYFRL